MERFLGLILGEIERLYDNEEGYTGCGKTRAKGRYASGHDRGTLWVACRKCRKINVAFRPG